MKKIVISAAVAILLCYSCGNRNRTNTEATPSLSTDTISAVTAAGQMPAQDSALQADAVSGATSVGNQATFNGTLIIPPQNHATVTLTMDGTVKSTSLLPGAYIKKGELLVTLENPAFITLQQVYLDGHAQTEFLQNEYRRQQTLSREEAASQKKFQQSKADYFSMKSKMDAAAAQLSLLGVDTSVLLSDGIEPCMEIKAPISGYVSDMQMNVGKHFKAGDPLCHIIDKSNTMLRLTAYEKDLATLKAGSRIEFRVNGMGKQTFHAVLISVGQQVDDLNRSVDVYARITEQHAQFRPGMYVMARVEQK